MIHRIVIAATASLGAALVLWGVAQHRWERAMLRETRRGGEFRG